MNESRLKELGVPDNAIAAVIAEWNKTFGALERENESFKARISSYSEQIKSLEKFKGDNEQLTERIKKMTAEQSEASEKHTKEMNDYRKKQAIRYAIGTMKDSKPFDSDIVMSQIDQSKIEVDDNGVIKSGFDEQIGALKKEKSFLFSSEASRKGVTPVVSASVNESKPDSGLSLGARIAARTMGNASNN